MTADNIIDALIGFITGGGAAYLFKYITDRRAAKRAEIAQANKHEIDAGELALKIANELKKQVDELQKKIEEKDARIDELEKVTDEQTKEIAQLKEENADLRKRLQIVESKRRGKTGKPNLTN